MPNKYTDYTEASKAGLLWKSMERQSEVQSGIIRLNREVTIRILKNKPEHFLDSNRYEFTMAMKDFLKTVVTFDREKLEYFIFRIYDSYIRELSYIKNRDEQFSIDILFQVIESLALEKESQMSAGSQSGSNSMNLEGTNLTQTDLEIVKNHIKAFNLMSVQFQNLGNIKKAIEFSDRIILKTATMNPMVTIVALENMFSLILAQNILATKYGIANLLKGWMNEYGFTKDQVERIIPLFPRESSLNDFRTVYSQAMKVLVQKYQNTGTLDMDLFMLRTVCNYFTSWLNRVANQLPNAA